METQNHRESCINYVPDEEIGEMRIEVPGADMRPEKSLVNTNSNSLFEKEILSVIKALSMELASWLVPATAMKFKTQSSPRLIFCLVQQKLMDDQS